MSNSTNLNLPYILPSQAQKHVTHNEAITNLDVLVQLSVVNNNISTPPQSPDDGDCYIIAPSSTGAWAGKVNQIAAWQDEAWAFYSPQKGWVCWVENQSVLLAYNGTSWIVASSGSGGSGGSGGVSLSDLDDGTVKTLGVNADADTTNRLSVNSAAILFNKEVDDVQVKLNKQAVSDSASFLFQTNFLGRAEFGTTGDDDFHIKVSSNGTTWKDGLIIDAATGAVSFPNTSLSGGPGAKGDKGDKGDIGDTGADGADGQDGVVGPMGPVGATGAAGTTGAKGDKGDKGEKGDAGSGGGGSGSSTASNHDINMLALRIADLVGDRMNMVDGIADPFEDESGVDTTVSDGTFDSTEGHYHTTSSEISPGTISTQSVGNNHTRIDRAWTIHNGKIVKKLKFYSLASLTGATLKIYKRNSSGNYTLIDEITGLSHDGSGWNEFDLVTPYTVPASGDYYVGVYHSSKPTKGVSNARAYITGDVGTSTSFTEATTGGTWATGVVYDINATLQSSAFTADSQPTTARLSALVKPIGSLTPNTDLIASVSRDGGTTWAVATLSETVTQTDGTKMYVDESIDVSSQPSGTAMKWKLEAHNNKEIEFSGVVLQWS